MAGLETALLPQRSDALFDRDTRALNCVNMPVERKRITKAWFKVWYQTFSHQIPCVKTLHLEALARLVPTLLCGEQSAVSVFHAEAERLSQKRTTSAYRYFEPSRRMSVFTMRD